MATAELSFTTKGTLFKWTNYVHGWQPRYFILKNGVLMYHKSEHETSYGCRGAIAVKASTLTLHDFDICRFDVGVSDYVWYLRAETKAERDTWIRAFEDEAQAHLSVENSTQSVSKNANATTTTDTNTTNTTTKINHTNGANHTEAVSSHPSSPLWPKIDQITCDQLYHAQSGLGEPGTTDGWQLFAEDGLMRLYSRELEIDGLVCDPLKAVHVVNGVTGLEICHRFFSPDTRFEWEQTLESMKVVEKIDNNTLIFHQIHKRIWPAAQRDAVFWSHIRHVEEPKPSYLSSDDINPSTRPDLRLHSVWIVCNNSTDQPEVALGSCVRIRLTVSLVCETYVPAQSELETIRREDLVCKIIYSSTINPGGWAPAAILRSVYRREYPKFLDNFSNYVIASTKSKRIVFE